jgi:7-cyano-7-deazaguanine tRNA-ribosyltransferase
VKAAHRKSVRRFKIARRKAPLMEFAFEVRESDLMGRIGRIRVGGKVLETPSLLPVIHPVSQQVTTKELESMGFGGLMTNSYIMMSRRGDEALEKGIHRALDYGGVFMTDSGGYQALEYGNLDLTYRRVASFQTRIGSELSVTLDRPTGFSASREYAKGTVDYSLRNALATMREFGQSKTVWVGPVQGGVFPRLLSRSARSLLSGGFAYLALGSPVQVMDNYRFGELVDMIVATRRAIPYAVPLHLFGAGHPLTMALSIALGCDTFDSASYILFARNGRYMTERGVSKLDSLEFLPCSCPVCIRATTSALKDLDTGDRTKALALHNLYILKKEVEACKEAIAEGRLWDLVQEKAIAHPSLFGALRNFADARDLLSGGTPLLKRKGLFVRNELDFARPELAMARDRLRRTTKVSSKTAVLVVSDIPLPMNMLRLPAKNVPSHCDFYRFHPVLGPYPAELEFVYPYTQTVTPSSKNPVPSAFLKQLRKAGYSKIVVVTADDYLQSAPPEVRSRPRRRGSSPSPQSASTRPQWPRRP